MQRRAFITLLGGAAAAWPLPSRAQQRKAMPRVGVLWHAANAKQEEEYLGALTKAFQGLGYFEGKNIELDHRFPGHLLRRQRVELRGRQRRHVAGLDRLNLRGAQPHQLARRQARMAELESAAI